VFLGRVLRELDRTVRPPVKPCGVLFDPRMVGRALNGEIERDFQAVLVGSCNKASEVFEASKLRMNGIVSAFTRADGVGASGVARHRLQRVVARLSVRAPYGMNGRQIENVEAKVFHVWEAANDVVERSMSCGITRLRAGHHLVPGAERGSPPVDPYSQILLVAREISTQAGTRIELGGLPLQQNRKPREVRLGAGQLLWDFVKPAARLGIACCGSRPGALDQLDAFHNFTRDRLACSALLLYLVTPGRKLIAPGNQGVEVKCVLLANE